MNSEINKLPSEKKSFARILVSLFAIIASLAIFWVYFIRPIEGNYYGHFIDALSSDSVFLLKNGTVYIKPIDHPPILFGQYSNQGHVWFLREGTNQVWILKQNVFGFEMICATNQGIRYNVVRTWLKVFAREP